MLQKLLDLCLSDLYVFKGRQSLDPSPAPQTTKSKNNSKTKTINSKSKASKAELEKDKEWPKLSSPKVPDWTNLLLESPKTIDWSSSDRDSVFQTPDSLQSSLYLSAEDKPFQSSPVNGKQLSFLNSPDNLRRRNLNPLRKPLQPQVVSEPQQTFTNWSDNMVIGSKSNFLSSDHLQKSTDEETKSKILQNRVCALAEPTGLKGQRPSETSKLRGQSSTETSKLRGQSSTETSKLKGQSSSEPTRPKGQSSTEISRLKGQSSSEPTRSKGQISPEPTRRKGQSSYQATDSKKDRLFGVKDLSSSSNKKEVDLKEEQKSKSNEPVSWWDSPGTIAGSNVQSSSLGSDYDSSGSEKRSLGRGRGKRVKKEITGPQKSTTPIQKAEESSDKQGKFENYTAAQKRVNPLRTPTDESHVKPQNVIADSDKISGKNSEKSPQKVMDWFSMEEVVTGVQPSGTISSNNDDVPDDWFLASDDEKCAKDSHSSDFDVVPNTDSDKTSDPVNTGTSHMSYSGDSPITSNLKTDITDKLNSEDGSGDGQSRLAHLSDNEAEDDGMWETDSSSDDTDFQPVDTTETCAQATGMPRWVPGQRKCTLCGGTDHVIYKCPQKKQKNFFL
jgi:hypothetical protein